MLEASFFYVLFRLGSHRGHRSEGRIYLTAIEEAVILVIVCKAQTGTKYLFLLSLSTSDKLSQGNKLKDLLFIAIFSVCLCIKIIILK